MSGSYLCNVVVPGAAKSGTSSLHELLDAHPKICMSTSKEPHFFSKDDAYRRGPGFHNALFNSQGGEVYFGESSTGYLIWPEAIERIRRDLVAPKIIMILRDPIERAFSHYRWRVRLGYERRSFLDAMKEDGDGFDPQRPDGFGYMSYLQFSRYSKYCPLWVEAFGEENCLFLNTASLQADAHGTLARIHDFLGLENVRPEHVVESNRTEDVARRHSPFRAVGRILPEGLKRTTLYQAARKRMLAAVTTEPPKRTTEKEMDHAAAELAEDTRYFRALFG